MPGKRTWRAAAAASVLVLFSGTAGTAHANGRFPAASQLVVFPGAPQQMVLRATFGLLFTSDGGKSWDWVCERAVGYGGVENPGMGVLGTDTVLASTFEGLGVSQDRGCNWAFAQGDAKGQSFIDVTRRPGGSALALASTFTGGGDASTYANWLFETTDQGVTWNRYGAALPSYLIAQTVDVAPGDGTRVYVSGTRKAGADTQGLFYASADDGKHFTETQFPLSNDEGAPFIAAVDPTNPQRVYVRTGRPDPSTDSSGRLLVSDNGGTDFREAFNGPNLLGFALSEDGSQVWIGNIDGLYSASRTDLKFTKRSSVVVQCLARSGNTLYACSKESSGFTVGASTDGGNNFTPLLHLTSIRGPLACPAQTTAASCTQDWPAIQDQLGVAADAGDGEGPPPSGGGGGGCSVVAAGAGSAAALLSALVLAVGALVRRRPPRGEA